MSFLNKYVLYAIGSVLGLLLCYGYVSITQAEITSLRASEALYKAQAEANASVATQNAKEYALLLEQRKQEQEIVLKLQKQIKEQQEIVVQKEKETIRYVSELPDGFEKQCFNMVVPDNVGRVRQ